MLQARAQLQEAGEALNMEQGAEQGAVQLDPAPQELCPGAGRAGDTVSRWYVPRILLIVNKGFRSVHEILALAFNHNNITVPSVSEGPLVPLAHPVPDSALEAAQLRHRRASGGCLDFSSAENVMGKY